MRIKEYIEEKKKLIDTTLENLLPPREGSLRELSEAMRYTLLSGGKRIRPILALAAYETVKKENPDHIAPIASSIEFIHAYSLIHDDLPALDNDKERRGMPTNHVVFGEGMAILAGDALLTEAFKVAVEGCAKAGYPGNKAVEIVRVISSKAGLEGMVGGQSMDIRWRELPPTPETLKELVYRKTGALIECSVIIGGILADASEREMESLSLYGRYIGMAFQIVDDLHDLDDDNSLTYPSTIGIEKSVEEARKLTEKAKEALSIFGEETILHGIADFLKDRTY